MNEVYQEVQSRLQITKGNANRYLLALLCLSLCSCVHTRETNPRRKENVNTYKKDVMLWYEAFQEKDPTLLDRILSKEWIDIPPAPNQPAGPDGAKQILAELGTTFPDLKIKIEDILQDGDKVVVRSTITGTQKGTLIGFAAKNRAMSIQAIDIHQFRDRRIVRTWHTEDWMTGLHQLGVFEK